jgi:hypothetical protein
VIGLVFISPPEDIGAFALLHQSKWEYSDKRHGFFQIKSLGKSHGKWHAFP